MDNQYDFYGNDPQRPFTEKPGEQPQVPEMPPQNPTESFNPQRPLMQREGASIGARISQASEGSGVSQGTRLRRISRSAPVRRASEGCTRAGASKSSGSARVYGSADPRAGSGEIPLASAGT